MPLMYTYMFQYATLKNDHLCLDLINWLTSGGNCVDGRQLVE